MADDPNNLILEHLRGLRSELREIRDEQREQRMRLNSIERKIALIHAEIANFHGQLAETGSVSTAFTTALRDGSTSSKCESLHEL